jgi:hypothetical protein
MRLVARGMRQAVPVASPAARSFVSTPAYLKAKQTSDPTPITESPQFPAPTDPFHPEPEVPQPQKYSEGTKTLVRGVARLMGYNSRTSTAIRETGRMMRGVVEAVEVERSFWYDSTYSSCSHTFLAEPLA